MIHPVHEAPVFVLRKQLLHRRHAWREILERLVIGARDFLALNAEKNGLPKGRASSNAWPWSTSFNRCCPCDGSADTPSQFAPPRSELLIKTSKIPARHRSSSGKVSSATPGEYAGQII